MIGLSNLQLRSNLLSSRYQEELGRITVFEAQDIHRRNNNLGVKGFLSADQHRAWQESLFWGDRQPTLEQDGGHVWFKSLAGQIAEALDTLEDRANVEDAFELLVVITQLARPDDSSHVCPYALEWERRVRRVLARDEFRFSSDMIDQRLEAVLGFPVSTIDQLKAVIEAGDFEVGGELQASKEVLCISEPSSQPVAESGIRALDVTSDVPGETPVVDGDADLARLKQSWPLIPSHIKAAILTLLDAVDKR